MSLQALLLEEEKETSNIKVKLNITQTDGKSRKYETKLGGITTDRVNEINSAYKTMHTFLDPNSFSHGPVLDAQRAHREFYGDGGDEGRFYKD